MPDHDKPTLVLLPWGNVIEDFLDGIGLSFADFCDEMSGGWLFGYVGALQLSGWRVVIVCPSRDAKEVSCRRQRATGAPVYCLPAWPSYRYLAKRLRNPYGWTAVDAFGPVARPLRPLAELLRLIAPYLATPPASLLGILRTENCTALMVQEYEYARFDVCVALARWAGIPVFATFQGGDRHGSRLETALRPLALKACDGLVIGSRAEVARLSSRYGVPHEKIALIGNPIDLATWTATPRAAARQALGMAPEARVAIWHGRIDIHRKGLDILVEAWRRVIAARPALNLRLLLVGDGADSDRLAALLEAMPLPTLEWVRDYVMDRPLMARMLSAADLYVMSSRVEGFPVAPLEAMACGLPIVAADANGVGDILAGGEASGGVLVPRGDPEALATAMTRMLDNPDLSLELGRRARRTVERRFALAAVGEDLAHFLNERVGLRTVSMTDAWRLRPDS